MDKEKSAFQIQLEEWGDDIVLRLQDPGRLRVAVLGIVGVIGLGLIGLPMYQRIQTLQVVYAAELARQTQIQEHKYIESQVHKLKKRLNLKADLNMWIEYMLQLTRESGLKVVEFRPMTVKGKQGQVGVMQGVWLSLDVLGSFVDVLKFIGRLENDKDIIRVTQVTLTKDTISAPMKTTMVIAVLMRKGPAPGEGGGGGGGGDAGAAAPAPAAGGGSPAAPETRRAEE